MINEIDDSQLSSWLSIRKTISPLVETNNKEKIMTVHSKWPRRCRWCPGVAGTGTIPAIFCKINISYYFFHIRIQFNLL